MHTQPRTDADYAAHSPAPAASATAAPSEPDYGLFPVLTLEPALPGVSNPVYDPTTLKDTEVPAARKKHGLQRQDSFC